jgi:hypothetical protein
MKISIRCSPDETSAVYGTVHTIERFTNAAGIEDISIGTYDALECTQKSVVGTAPNQGNHNMTVARQLLAYVRPYEARTACD